jgi:hypothetical protein
MGFVQIGASVAAEGMHGVCPLGCHLVSRRYTVLRGESQAFTSHRTAPTPPRSEFPTDIARHCARSWRVTTCSVHRPLVSNVWRKIPGKTPQLKPGVTIFPLDCVMKMLHLAAIGL